MKRLYLILILILCFCSGCRTADSPEATVKDFLNAAKEFDLEAMSQYVAESGFKTPGSDPGTQEALTGFFSNANRKLFYAIEDTVKTDENHAIVRVKVHYPDKSKLFAAISEQYRQQFAEKMTLAELLSKPPVEEREVFQETSLEIACFKTSDIWMVKSLDAALLNVITCNLANTYIP